MNTASEFWESVRVGAPHECWPWLRTANSDGYGHCVLGDRQAGANRVALVLGRAGVFDGSIDQSIFAGIPPSRLACHTCDNPACCNPWHLWWGSYADNVRDCVAKGRHAGTLRTHCPAGHPYDEANTRRDKRGRRACRTCNRAAVARYRARKEMAA